MTYPPTIPSNTRADGTAMLTNHKNDHNADADALTAIVARLGNSPGISSYPTTEERFAAYDRGSSFLVAHSTSHASYQEAADYVMTGVPATDTTNVQALLDRLVDVADIGGGVVKFAPTKNDYYNFGTALPLVLSPFVNIEFMGGVGSSLDGATDVQAYFAGGMILYSNTSFVYGNGTYLFGKSVSLFGSPTSGLVIAGSGVYVGGGSTGTPKKNTIRLHSSMTTATAFIDWGYGGTYSAPWSDFHIENTTINGGGIGVTGYKVTNGALCKMRNVHIFNCTSSAGTNGIGMAIDNLWDSFLDNVRFDWCGSRNQSGANIKGCIHISDGASGASNNVQLRNVTFETFGDRAIHIANTGVSNPNKFYWDNIKIENSAMYNSPLVYIDGLWVSSFRNIDITSGITASAPSHLQLTTPIVAQPQFTIQNCRSMVVDRYNMEVTAEAINRTVTSAVSASTTQNIATLGTNSQYVGWTVKILTNSAGTAVGTTATISSHTNTTATLSSSWTLATSANVQIYPANVSSFFQFNGGNSNISISNFLGSSQPYRTPTTAWVDFASTSDSDIRNLGGVRVHYNGDSTLVPYQQMFGGSYVGTSGVEQTYYGTVDTTNNTNTTILTIPLNLSTSNLIQHRVVARSSTVDGQSGVDFKSAVVAVTSAGVVDRTTVSANSEATQGADIIAGVTYVDNDSTTRPSITIQVQGLAATNITWACIVTVMSVGS